MKQLPLDLGFDATRTFDTFVTGANERLCAHLYELRPGSGGTFRATPPLYLWGPEGCGKTHLLQSTAALWQQRGGRSVWFDSETPLPWDVPDGDCMIVLDACERYDAARQHAAFAVFVEAADGGQPIVAAGRLPPVDLPLREDLRSRLGWGHVYAVDPLDDAQARAALRREADRRGLFLPDDVLDYLLSRFERDLKHLMQHLDELDTTAKIYKRALSVPLLRQMLAEREPR